MKFIKPLLTIGKILLAALFIINSGLLLFSPSTVLAAEVGCCTIETDYQSKYLKTLGCTTVSEEKCNGFATETSKAGQSIFKRDRYIQLKLPSCNQCSLTGDSFKTEILHKDWCCVKFSTLLKIRSLESCSAVALGTQKCLNGGQVYQQTCGTVGLAGKNCSQVSLIQKSAKETIAEQRDLTEKNVVKELTEGQIKPVLSTKIPGAPNEFANIEIKNLGGSRYISVPFIAQYIGWIYQYAIGIAGVIAVIMIMVGGFAWIVSAGDTTKISKAKDQITSAVFGLILVMSAYLIANFINPALLNPAELLIAVPEVDENTNKKLDLFLQCNAEKVNSGNILTVDGKTWCPEKKDFLNIFKELDLSNTKYKNVVTVAINEEASKKVITALKQIRDDFEKTKRTVPRFKDKTFFIVDAASDLVKQEQKCNAYYKCLNEKQGNINKHNEACGNKNEPPKCNSKNAVSGNSVSVTFKADTCGRFEASNMCRTNKNSHPDKKNCLQAVTSCQDQIYNMMTRRGFTAHPNYWWYFTI